VENSRRRPEIGERLRGWTASGKLTEGTYLATEPSGTSYRIALQGAGKVFIAAATAEILTERES
jgi:hypothetical protein